MRPGDLTSGAAKLHKAWQKLLVRWESTRVDWRDAVSKDFEENHLMSLEPQIIATLERMKALTGVMSAAQHECDARGGETL